jgi:hypothetical protein
MEGWCQKPPMEVFEWLSSDPPNALYQGAPGIRAEPRILTWIRKMGEYLPLGWETIEAHPLHPLLRMLTFGQQDGWSPLVYRPLMQPLRHICEAFREQTDETYKGLYLRSARMLIGFERADKKGGEIRFSIGDEGWVR